MKNTLSVITALFIGVGIATTVDAGVITAYTLSGSTLSTITIDGTMHTATNLINVTVTAITDNSNPPTDTGVVQMLISNGGTFPAAGSRSSVIEDLDLDTGILNVPNSTYTFDTPIVNTGVGKIDLVIFDWGGFTGNPDPDKFQVVIDGDQDNARAIGPEVMPDPDQGPGGDYFNGNPVTLSGDVYNGTGGVSSVADLESAMLMFTKAPGSSGDSDDIVQGVIGLDLSDFGVLPGDSVDTITINDETNTSVDPTLILGIQGPQAVPEPSSVALVCVGGVMFFVFSRRRLKRDQSHEHSSVIDS